MMFLRFCGAIITITVNRMIFTLREREVAAEVLGARNNMQTNAISLDPLTARDGMSVRDHLKSTAPGPNMPIELSTIVEVEFRKD
jgi:hypothetical protein